MKTIHTPDTIITILTNSLCRLNRLLWLCLILCSVFAARSETVIWTENFDDGNGDDRWFADQGVWQMGSPTVGPPTNAVGGRAFSGTRCATTGLTGNYLANQNSRLVRIASFTVPAANQNPRLRFWHWYEIYENDIAKVEVKPVGSSTWTVISPIYNFRESAVWSRPSLDLSPFAGQTVQVAFHFTSDSVSENFGWYVDDIALVTGTPVFNNPESFEGGLGDWATERGTWQVGVPTVGPPTNALGSHAFTGTNCAATVLDGNYPAFADSRLISPPLTVPAANQNPRLRFWHWYEIYENDIAKVEVKPVGSSTWTVISPIYNFRESAVWSRPSLDLSPFAGQTVQVAFHFTSDSVSENFGWYVDDIALVTGTPVFNNPESFEGGLGDWATERGTWQVGVPTSGPGAAYTGTNCAATVLDGNYPAFANSRLISPPFTVPPRSSSPALRFRQWFRFAGGDQGFVEIKETSTNTWTPLATYSGINGGWTYPFLDLSSFGGKTVQIAFHFTSDGAGQDVGWYVDELRLLHDFALLLLDSPIVRTQNMACVSLGIAASSPASTVNFTMQAPAGNLGSLALNTVGCWTGSITPQPNSQWSVSLQSSCPTAPAGVQIIGSLCFTAVSAQSAFVPLSIDNNLVVTNQDASLPPTHAFGSRIVNIANEPLLEATLGTNKQRSFTVYGKANTAYQIQSAGSLNPPVTWTPNWTNTVPASLFYVQPLTGTFSNAPSLFLRANEQ